MRGPIEYGVVPRSWAGETAVCLATGASLTEMDVRSCQGRARVIAIKDAVQWAPWADVLYVCGRDQSAWWPTHGETLAFSGPRYTLDPAAAKYATVLKETGVTGLETNPIGLRTGRNSGYQAINLAVHFGVAKIVLLGYDMQILPGGRHHFFPKKTIPPFATFLPLFDTLIAPLRQLGVTLLNATGQTALQCFPCCSLEEALA